MHGVRDFIALDQVENALGRRDVVAHERLGIGITDLGLQHDDGVGALEVFFPLTGRGKIGVLDRQFWVKAAQDIEVGLVFVEDNQVGVAALF